MGVCSANEIIENTVYVIGKNNFGEFGVGLDEDETRKKIMCFNKHNKNKSITHIHSGNKYTIYANYESQHFYIAGKNHESKCKSINYFKTNNIKIKKICVNCASLQTFWITDANRLYKGGEKCQLRPKLVKGLHNVIDVQPSDRYNIALCQNIVGLVISHWIHVLDVTANTLSNDLLQLMSMFCDDKHIVYSIVGNTHSHFGGSGQGKKPFVLKPVLSWKRVNTFIGREIVSIRTGHEHSLFLESNGTVWCCGRNNYAQLGLGHCTKYSKTGYTIVSPQSVPIPIQYFIDNDIKIKQIDCGHSHNLAVDRNDNMYAWGGNWSGQCGSGTDENVVTPTLIKSNVFDIQCGSYHSYCVVDTAADICVQKKELIDLTSQSVNKKEHFLWGDNDNKQCLANGYSIYQPRKLQLVTNDFIKHISLGNNNTKIVFDGFVVKPFKINEE